MGGLAHAPVAQGVDLHAVGAGCRRQVPVVPACFQMGEDVDAAGLRLDEDPVAERGLEGIDQIATPCRI